MAAPSRFFVHAEFTISHPGANDPENQPKTKTEQRDEGVKMTYTWKTHEDDGQRWESGSNRSAGSDHTRASSAGSKLTSQLYPRTWDDSRPGEFRSGFQRGNLFFTSTPPPKSSPGPGSDVSRRCGVQDSGYGSDLFSPTGGNRGKCRSTCNIMLSSSTRGASHQRTQSLRCQTPSAPPSASSYYGCGDPWCHHTRPAEDLRFSPLMEEDVGSSSRRPSRASTFNVADAVKKDVSVQTFEMVDKCTSPFMRNDSFQYLNAYNRSPQPYGNRRKLIGSTSSNSRTRIESGVVKDTTESVTSFTPDSLENIKPSKRVTRTSGLKRFPAIDRTLKKEISPIASDSKSTTDSQKKPRTVHIDVYCTGTEIESSSSSEEESSGSKTASTPQTVFESEKVRVTHANAGNEELPFHLRQNLNIKEKKKKSNRNLISDSDIDDTVSTAYPSKLSSYSTIRDFSESVSSVPWTNYSMSSCAIDTESLGNTSWKDTTFSSDIDNFMHNSRSSVDAASDSVDFVPRKLFSKSASIDETPELLGASPSVTSLQPSDSFEYANSDDKVRIKRMEEMWKSRPWKSPQTLLQQQKKMQEYMEKKLQDKQAWQKKSKDSSDESDQSEKGWSIVKQRETTTASQHSDPNPTAPKHRLSLDPNLRSPFTLTPGIFTEPRHIASKFGAVVNVLKKPGHHIGPAKNPDCSCDHCQSYWDKIGRNRTRSMGDSPMTVVNWKKQFRSENK